MALPSASMSLLVGLGNPGPQYEATRHNIGFALADSMARALLGDGASEDWKTRGKALVCKASLGSHPLLIVKPQTFMNLSGEAVQSLMAFFKIPPAQVVVVTDDVTLPLGSIRVRSDSGHGGHNGLRNIIEHIGEGFPRIRVGVGLCPPGRDLAAFVLARMSAAEREALSPVFTDFPKLLETGLTKGWETASARFNRRTSA
jgi:PTH1 family peptidyl-tRNA hydrolase